MKGRKTLLLLLLVNLFSIGLFGQASSIFDEVEYTDGTGGKVRIVQEEAIENLVERHQWAKSKRKGIVGYQLRIFSNSGPTAKEEFDKTMARFSYLYDTIPIYPKFVHLNYKIYVGDFRSESEALKFRKQIEHQFTGAFIAPPRKINYPKIELNE